MESLSELAAPPPSDYWANACWNLVVCRDGDYATIHEFGTEDEVAAEIRKYDGTDTIVFVVHGRQAKISRKPQRFLILPDCEQVLPIFDVSALGLPARYTPQGLDLAVQENGFLGRAEYTLPIPKGQFKLESKHPTVVPDTPPRHEDLATDDEEEDEDFDEYA